MFIKWLGLIKWYYPRLVYYLAVEHHLLTHRGYISAFFTGFLASPSNKWGKPASVFISSASRRYIFAFLSWIREKKILVLKLSLCNISNYIKILLHEMPWKIVSDTLPAGFIRVQASYDHFSFGSVVLLFKSVQPDEEGSLT